MRVKIACRQRSSNRTSTTEGIPEVDSDDDEQGEQPPEVQEDSDTDDNVQQKVAVARRQDLLDDVPKQPKRPRLDTRVDIGAMPNRDTMSKIPSATL